MSFGPWDPHKGYTGKYKLNGKPVAEQILSATTEVEFKKFLSTAANGGRHVADEFMRTGKSKWIARSYAEGWNHVLRDIVAELCRRHMLEQGRFPTDNQLNGLTINTEDHESYKAIGAHS